MMEEQLQGLDKESRGHELPTMGMGVVIINAKTGEILAVQERFLKERSGRASGQLSIQLETRKIGEGAVGNMEGAIAEAFDDVDHDGRDVRADVIGSLYCVGQIPQKTLIVGQNGSRIKFDVVALLHDGRDIPTRPYSHEVEGSHWVAPETFLGAAGVRPLARVVIEELLTSGLYRELLFTFRNSPESRRPVFNPDFSIRTSSTCRELLPDIVF